MTCHLQLNRLQIHTLKLQLISPAPLLKGIIPLLNSNSWPPIPNARRHQKTRWNTTNKLRDTQHPLLISGQLRLPEAQAEIDEVLL